MPTGFSARFVGLPYALVKGPEGLFSRVTTKDIIKSSITSILTTQLGERVCLPQFGSRLPELIFEPNDEILKGLAREYSAEALRQWEPRITVLKTEVTAEAHQLRLYILYRINEAVEVDSLILVLERNV